MQLFSSGILSLAGCIMYLILTGNVALCILNYHTHNNEAQIIGRLYDYHLLDMVELGIDDCQLIETFKNQKIAAGIKPCLLFAGEPFNSSSEYQRLKNLLVDFFRGEEITGLRLAGLEHVISFTAAEGKIFMRSYRILTKKSGAKTPRVDLEEIGPRMDFSLRRTKLASDDLFKTSCKKPRQIKPKTVKNIKKDALGTTTGRIHLGKQDLSKLQVKRMKGLRKVKSGKKTSKGPKNPASI
ncbi:hypothetical protein QYM36_016082 [Artemia franciscana]|uniref:Ribosome production factor 2 homolog n=1 Tax=Artemia franciscana TaxID=6661 RepID=A0AA88KW37_ARTSF|nr:hypothetical protein QYM36_016082 [Artemia franciscana]